MLETASRESALKMPDTMARRDTADTEDRDIVQRVLAGEVEAFAPLSWQRERVDIVAEVALDLPPAMADAGRLDQVLVNLLRNALDACETGDQVMVSTRRAADSISVQDRHRCGDGP